MTFSKYGHSHVPKELVDQAINIIESHFWHEDRQYLEIEVSEAIAQLTEIEDSGTSPWTEYHQALLMSLQLANANGAGELLLYPEK